MNEAILEFPVIDSRIACARIALAETGLIRLDEKLGQMIPADRSSRARILAAAYNLIAEAHRKA
jgi:hypothetical protein